MTVVEQKTPRGTERMLAQGVLGPPDGFAAVHDRLTGTMGPWTAMQGIGHLLLLGLLKTKLNVPSVFGPSSLVEQLATFPRRKIVYGRRPGWLSKQGSKSSQL
jgi:hypothetical protein